MISLAGSILDKPRWYEKVTQPALVKQWETEATQQGASLSVFNAAMCLVRWHAAHDRRAHAGAVPGTFCEDRALPDALHEALLAGFTRLAKDSIDWHPGSDDQVLDLLHPSLYCKREGFESDGLS